MNKEQLDTQYDKCFNMYPDVLDDLIENFYKPALKQGNTEDTYFRLGQHDVLSYILSKIELNKIIITDGAIINE